MVFIYIFGKMSNYNLHLSTCPVFAITLNNNELKHNRSLTLLPSTFHTQQRAATTTAQFSSGCSHRTVVIPATPAWDRPPAAQQVPEPGTKAPCLLGKDGSVLFPNLSTFSRREASRLPHPQLLKSMPIKTFIYRFRRVNLYVLLRQPVAGAQPTPPARTSPTCPCVTLSAPAGTPPLSSSGLRGALHPFERAISVSGPGSTNGKCW